MPVSALRPHALSLLRIVTALIFLEHGTGKFLGFPALPALPPPWSMAWLAGLLELAGGTLLLVGLFSRPTAFLLSGMMAIGYWYAHFPRGPYPVLNGGDAAILYCFVFLYIFVSGPGPWSIDALRDGGWTPRNRTAGNDRQDNPARHQRTDGY